MYRDITNVEYGRWDWACNLSVQIGASGTVTNDLKKNFETVPGKQS